MISSVRRWVRVGRGLTGTVPIGASRRQFQTKGVLGGGAKGHASQKAAAAALVPVLCAKTFPLSFHLHAIFPQYFAEFINVPSFYNGVNNLASIHARIFDAQDVPDMRPD